MIFLASDYQEGAHPAILRRLQETNFEQSPGYGTDEICTSARRRIREACHCPGAAVHFLAGGTQANMIVVSSVLRPWQGVIAADTGHISSHEAGAIEAGGHKVLTLPHTLGKISAKQVDEYCRTWECDQNRDHMVMPGMVYISQPTEYGTLYTLEELSALREVCSRHALKLYVDGARLAYALAAGDVDAEEAGYEKSEAAGSKVDAVPDAAAPVTLPDLARLCDVFYIGGTKCGALLGEAVVIPDPSLLPHFFTVIKQRGALLAKGFVLGIQFDELFRDGLYYEIGKGAVEKARRIQEAFRRAGYEIAFESPTNQIFLILENNDMERLGKEISFSFWEKKDGEHTVVRIATSWATSDETVKQLERILI